MQFAQPTWILIGLLSCLGLYTLRRLLEKKRQKALERFAARGLLGSLTSSVSATKRNLKFGFFIAGVFCCFLALARPQYGHQWQEVKRKGIDILFAIDTSLSMGSEDVLPNRLSRAKLAILDFVDKLSGDRVGLLPFAGSAFLLCPLTVDYQAFEESLQAVDTAIIPRQGTNLAEAIRTAEAVLHNDANHKILILITDGESLQGDGPAAAREAADRGMTIFTIGVGTPAGELIPIHQNDQRDFVRAEDGNFVVSRLDEKTLRTIAETTKGLYAPLGNQGQGLVSIYQEKLSLIPEQELAERRQKIPIDRFPWFLGLALAFFIVEYLLNSRKSASGPLLPRPFRWKNSVALIIFFPLMELLQPAIGLSASPGEELFAAGAYEEANTFYQKALEDTPGDPAIHYNLGTTAYKRGRYAEAISAFNQALQSDDLALQEKTYYNLGNSYYRQGETTQNNHPQKTIEHWQEALTAFRAALKLHPENEEARLNHKFVKRKLDLLQQQQQSQENKGDQSSQQEDTQDDQPQENGSQSENKQNRDEHRDQAESPENQESSENEEVQPQPQQGRPQKEEDQQQQIPNQQYTPGQKMSREEAEQLLREMQNEEGRLDFMPRSENDNATNPNRNW